MSRYRRVERIVPWIIVAVFLAGAVIVGLAIVAGSLLLGVIGSVTVVAAGLAGAILPHVGLSAPMSFSVNFPDDAGERGSLGGGDDGRPYKTLPEVPARKLPKGADRGRAKPQQMNLGPHERLRIVGGEEVIEIPEKERDE